MALDNSIFRKPHVVPEYRLSVNSEGLDRSGKTTFALSAPGPVGILVMDRNSMDMAIKAQSLGKEVYVADFVDPSPKNPLSRFVLPPREEGGKPVAKDKQADKSFYEKRWDAISNAYFDLVKEKSINTIIPDTGSSLYEACRLARFGKLTMVMPKEYGAINAELATMVLAAKCNLIIPHRLKKAYKNNEWNGKDYEGIGYNGVGYDCAVTLRHESYLVKDPDDSTRKKVQFKTTIINCSHDASLMGLELTDEDSNFLTLATLIFPDAPDGTWG